MRRAVLAVLLSLLAGASAMAALPPADTDTAAWFERFKAEATDEELYRFLYAMPKGGDLHNHLSGSILSEWFYDLACSRPSAATAITRACASRTVAPTAATRLSSRRTC
jgi:hypothetical protein